MSRDGCRPACALGPYRFAEGWGQGRADGSAARSRTKRRRTGRAILSELEHLESRTMLSGTPQTDFGPAALSLQGPLLNLVLAPATGGSLGPLAGLIAKAGGSVEATGIPGYYLVQAPAAAVGSLQTQLAGNSAVEYAAPPRTVQAADAPNNPSYDNNTEWFLNGQFGINAPGAWNVTTGSSQVIVADTDSGISYNNPQLLNNIWINQAEIPASVRTNLTDTNGDGLITFADLNAKVNGVAINQGSGKIQPLSGSGGVVNGSAVLAPLASGGWASGSTQDGATATPDDLIGWNFVSSTDNPIDQEGHGTFTAGEIAAVGNSNAGVSGANWSVQIMGVQFLDNTGNGTDTAAALAIEYAVNHGAKVINASWGGSGTDATIAAAIQYADEYGVIIVAAAGNSGTNDDNSATWFSPASYSVDYPNLISVAATTISGTRPNFSNYGVQSVQIAAPGNGLYGLGLNNGFGSMSGTSMAAPLVTATVALVEAAHPTWSMSQVIDAVLNTATPDPALAGLVSSGGIVNASAAVANTNGPYVVSSTPSGAIAGGSGFSSIQVTFNEEINPATFTPSQVSLSGPGGILSGISIAAVAGSNDHVFNIAFPNQSAAGAYSLTLGPDVQDWYGNDMNQNRNGANGEATADQFSETIERASGSSSDVLLLSGVPGSVTAGATFSFTVTALAPGGGTDTGFVGTVDLSSSDPQVAGLPATFAFTSTNKGTHTFTGVAFKTAGPQSITATAAAVPAETGTEGNILVQPAAAKSLLLSDSGNPASGVPFAITVTAMDAYGNVATRYGGTVNLSSTDPAAELPVTYSGNTPAAPVAATYSFAPEQQGTGTFYVTFETSGTQSLTATDSSNSTITGTAASLGVQGGSAALSNPYATTTAFASPVGTAASGQSVTLTATVTASGAANPTDGTVAFFAGSTLLGTVSLSGTNQASYPAGPLSPGTYAFFAVYNGNAATYKPSASPGFTQFANHFAANVALAASSPTSSFGQSVTFTATVSVVGVAGVTSPAPTGTVTFYDGTTALGTQSLNASNQSTLSTSSLAPGTHSIVAVYNGDSLTQTNQSVTLAETVAPASQSVVYVNAAWTGNQIFSQVTVGGNSLTIGVNAFATIQGGVDGVASGGTVNVLAGTYSEQVTIGQSLTISGAGASSTILSAPPGATGGSQIELSAGSAVSVTISGLSMSGSSLLTGIVANAGASLTATGVVISGGDIGISVQYTSTATITGSTITADDTGIWVANAGTATVTQSAINGCTTGILVGNGGGDIAVLTAQQDDLSGNVVALKDMQNAAVSTAPAAVATSDWWGTLHGPSTTANPGGNGGTLSGNVNFSPWIGTYTASGSPGFSPTISALYAAPTQLVFSTEPSSSAGFGAQFAQQPVVEAEDASGNLGINFDSTTVPGSQVNLALNVTSGVGSLAGTFPINAAGGFVTFTNLSITHHGVYTLAANALPTGNPWSSLITTSGTSTTITVNPAANPPTVTVTDAGGTYNKLPFAASATITPNDGSPFTKLQGQGINFVYYVGTGTGGTNLGGTAPTNAGTYTVVATFPGSTDYASASSSTSFTISPVSLTITAVANSKTYSGTTAAAAVPTITSGTLASGDTAGFIETYSNRNVGTGLTLTPGGVVNDGNSGKNYTYSYVAASNGVITVRSLTVTAAADSKTYDFTTAAAVIPTVTAGSIASGDTANFVEAYDTPNVGTGKTLTPGGGVSDGNSGNNYAYTFVPVSTGVITAAASQGWPEYALNPQHTATSPVASQPLGSILWQAPVDLQPQYNGSDLLIHYGSPILTPSNTVIIPVKTGTTSGFEIQARSGSSGASQWTLTSDYALEPSSGANGYSWIPSYSPTLTPQNGLYYPADGGTVMYVASPDATGPSPPPTSRLAFYGLSSYTANSSAYNSNIFINTPIISDSSGDLFFGFLATRGERPGIDERCCANRCEWRRHLGSRSLRDVAGGDQFGPGPQQ